MQTKGAEMPRIRVNAIQYKQKDLAHYIRYKMAWSGKTQTQIAEVLGISQPALSKKMRTGTFGYAELVKILAEVEATDEEIIRLMRKDIYK